MSTEHGPTMLEAYKARRDLWIRCLNGEDSNSIFQQVSRMIWNSAVFRIIIEARRDAPRTEAGTVRFNGMIHSFLDSCFFESQALAIRRLTDKYPISEDRRGHDVYSVISLLNDIKENTHLMTRENMLRAEGLEYDFEKVRQREEEYCGERISKGENAFFIPEELDWERISERHKIFDFLSETQEENRSPKDTLKPRILEHLANKVTNSSQELSDYVNKFIAHASTPESRYSVESSLTEITFNYMWQAEETICKITNFLDAYLLTGSSHAFLPVPQMDIFAFITEPLTGQDNVTKLRQGWESFKMQTEKWSNWGITELKLELDTLG